jgi:hypothetical protein
MAVVQKLQSSNYENYLRSEIFTECQEKLTFLTKFSDVT